MMAVTERIPDIAVVVVAVNDTVALNGCVRSVLRSIDHAASRGYEIEPAILLREGDPRAAAWVDHELGSSWRRIRCGEASIGAARNAALAETCGRNVAFIDGTDLWCETWLTAAMEAMNDEPAIWRPEALITFVHDHFSDEGYSLRLQADADGAPDALLSANGLASGLVSGMLCPRSIIDAVPFPEDDVARGWGLVDAWWNCNAAAAGYRHRILPETFHYRRLNRATMARHASADKAAPRIGPTPLADQQDDSGALVPQ